MEQTLGILAIIGFGLSVAGIIYRLSGVLHDVEELTMEKVEAKKELKEQAVRLANHIADNAAHVNHLYIGSMKEKIDKLDTTLNGRMERMETTMTGMQSTMNGAFRELTQKLDRNYASRNNRPKQP